MTNTQILLELKSVAHALDLQIKQIEKVAEELGCEPFEVRHSNGDHALSNLLCAKANVLCSLERLNNGGLS